MLNLAYKIRLEVVLLVPADFSEFGPFPITEESNDSMATTRRLFRETQQFMTCSC